MNWARFMWQRATLLAIGVLVVGYALPATAASLTLTGGQSITIDTTALTISGDATATGGLVGGVAQFNFDDISIADGATVTFIGANPLSLRAKNNISIGADLNFSGGNALMSSGTVGAGGTGVLGGGDGGSVSGSTAGTGSGPGSPPGPTGGGESGNGASFGGLGGTGSFEEVSNLGPIYGTDTQSPLLAGSGGAAAPDSFGAGGAGGAGGGALELFSKYGKVTILSTGSILSDGGDGDGGRTGGGGSGGGLLINANEIIVEASALLSADGGDSTVSATRDGGGGGGGRITFLTPLLTVAGVDQVAGFLTSGTELSVLGGAASSPGSPGGAGIIYFEQTDERVIPEPSTYAMFAMGLVGIGILVRRRKKKAAAVA